MEKRILIAFLLSFAVLYGARLLYPPAPTDKPQTETAVAPAPVQEQPAAPVEATAVTGEVVQADSEKIETVETPHYRAVISNVGGVLKSFQLTDPKYKNREGKPTELIGSYAGTQVGFPFALKTADPALDKILAQAKFVAETQGMKVSLEYQASGVRALKVFEFDTENYLVKASTKLERNGVAVPHQIVWQGRFGDQSIRDIPASRNAVYHAAGKYNRVVVSGLSEPREVTASSAGVEDQYFLAMFVRETESPVKLAKQDYSLADLPEGTKGAAAVGLSVAVPATEELKVYIGPKQQDSLAQADPKLGDVINFGWFLFAAIAKPLLAMLLFINSYIGNFGWSIIILTFVINMVLFPLKVKQQVVMQRMQKHAPQLRQLQEKYKKLKPGDPRRAEVEKELMEMNKQQLSGCLPMLLQMPLLFAFLNMMSAAIELRGAPWIFWIKDLSQPDIVLPILFGVAMFVQMKTGPTSPDPAQAKMAYLTPILITALFLWYQSASGLSLYWLAGNVIGIGQQYFIKKHWSD